MMFSFAKIFESQDPVSAGGVYTYILQVENAGACQINTAETGDGIYLYPKFTLPEGGGVTVDSGDLTINQAGTPTGTLSVSGTPDGDDTVLHITAIDPGVIAQFNYTVTVDVGTESCVDCITFEVTSEVEHEVENIARKRQVDRVVGRVNDQAVESTSIESPLDLQVIANSTVSSAIAGDDDTVEISIYVINYGPSTATDVVVSTVVVLPDGTQRIAIEDEDGSYVDQGTNGVYSGPSQGEFRIPSLASGDSAYVTFTVDVLPGAHPGDIISFEGTITAVNESPDTDTSNDSDIVEVVVDSQVDLTLSSDGDAKVAVTPKSSSSSTPSDSSTSTSSSSDSSMQKKKKETKKKINYLNFFFQKINKMNSRFVIL